MDREGSFFKPYLPTSGQLLDLGCGPGSLTLDLAQLCGPQSSIIGVDLEDQQFPQDHPDNVSFKAASAYDLPFENNSFDAVLAHAVFYHLDDPQRGLNELFRVVRPGGVVGLRDADMAGDICSPLTPELDLAWRIVKASFGQAGSNVYFGRQQSRALQQAGFKTVALSASYDVFADKGNYTAASFAQFWVDYIARHGATTDYPPAAIEQAQRALQRWGADNNSYYARARCEAVARKPQ